MRGKFRVQETRGCADRVVQVGFFSSAEIRRFDLTIERRWLRKARRVA
jgi:hypothetical protein